MAKAIEAIVINSVLANPMLCCNCFVCCRIFQGHDNAPLPLTLRGVEFTTVEVTATFAWQAVDCASCTTEGAIHAFAVHTVGAWAVAFFVGLLDLFDDSFRNFAGGICQQVFFPVFVPFVNHSVAQPS